MLRSQVVAPVPGWSTAPELSSEERLRGARSRRRLTLSVLAIFVLAGGLDVLGSRTATVSASGGGYELRVTYPAVTRPGLPVRWEIEVVHPGGFPGPVRLSTTFDYFRSFDISNTEPPDVAGTTLGGSIVYVFARPVGDRFVVSFDGNTEPDLHAPTTATTSVIVDGSAAVSVRYRTVVVP